MDGEAGFNNSASSKKKSRSIFCFCGLLTSMAHRIATWFFVIAVGVAQVEPRPWYISRVAGTGEGGNSGDGGPALSARLNDPEVGCSDGAGGYLFVSRLPRFWDCCPVCQVNYLLPVSLSSRTSETKSSGAFLLTERLCASLALARGDILARVCQPCLLCCIIRLRSLLMMVGISSTVREPVAL